MIPDLDLARGVNLAGAVAVAALGAALFFVRPRSRTNVAFGVFAVAWGFGFLGNNLFRPEDPRYFLGQAWDGTSFLVAAVALGVAAVAFPRALGRVEKALLVAPALAIACVLPLAVVALPLAVLANGVASIRGAPQILGIGLHWGVAMLWALRAARSETTPAERRQYAILSTAIVLYPTLFVAFLLDPGLLVWAGVVTVVLAASLAGCWLYAGARAVDPRLARAAALWPLAIAAVTLALAALRDPGFVNASAMPGIMRLATVAVLVYAVLRHQLLGIDVKVRWTISKSTIAAVFIAVFFIASEGAQQFLGETLGSTYVGIAAAGLLVFVIAPLQRAAERLAERAVPVREQGLPVAAGGAALYRAQVALAWTDGRISPNERVMLRGLRKDLGLDAEAADAIEHDVETERLRRDAS